MARGTPYSGTGYFKFAWWTPVTTRYWSNDGSSTAVRSRGDGGVACPATGCLLSCWATLLERDDQPLAGERFQWDNPLAAGVVQQQWVEFTLLSPDQRVAAVPYALQAAEAPQRRPAHGAAGQRYQLRVTGTCAGGQRRAGGERGWHSELRCANYAYTRSCSAVAGFSSGGQRLEGLCGRLHGWALWLLFAVQYGSWSGKVGRGWTAEFHRRGDWLELAAVTAA